MEEDVLRSQKPLKVTLEETIPGGDKKAEIVAFLKSVPITPVDVDHEVGINKTGGFSFPTTAPWSLMITKHIKSLKVRPNLGDWGCGHGFFSRHALLSGANPWALDSSKAAATEANKNIWATKKYLAKGLELKNLYKVFHGSVTDPSAEFTARQNHINIAFNVLHYLSPSDADRFLQKLYENTASLGIVVLCCDTPFDPNGISLAFYQKRKKQGVKYPGFGLYSSSTVVFQDGRQGDKERAVSSITEAEEKAGTFKMGHLYQGVYPPHAIDNGQTIRVDNPSLGRGILGKDVAPYTYSSIHYAFNKFDFQGLAMVLESAGFSVINGWYANHHGDTLYPIGVASGISASKVVVAAQKHPR